MTSVFKITIKKAVLYVITLKAYGRESAVSFSFLLLFKIFYSQISICNTTSPEVKNNKKS